MNQIIRFLVAVFSTLVVVGTVLYGLDKLLGEWSTLMWAGLCVTTLLGVMKKLNS